MGLPALPGGEQSAFLRNQPAATSSPLSMLPGPGQPGLVGVISKVQQIEQLIQQAVQELPALAPVGAQMISMMRSAIPGAIEAQAANSGGPNPAAGIMPTPPPMA